MIKRVLAIAILRHRNFNKTRFLRSKVLILLLIFSLVQPLNLSSESTRVRPPFRVGEKMVFAIKAFGVTAGHATLEIKEIINLDGHEVYHIVVTAQTTPFFSLFYRINDRLETYLDTKEFYPHRYEAHLEEGKYRKDEVIIYDQEKHIAHRKGKEIKIPPRVQDSVSVYYYLRTLNLKTGDVIKVPINCGRHNYLLTLKVKGEERIHTKDGHHQAFILIPQTLTLEGETKRKGEATAWLSVAEKTLLLAKVSRAGIFSARVVLIKWTP